MEKKKKNNMFTGYATDRQSTKNNYTGTIKNLMMEFAEEYFEQFKADFSSLEDPHTRIKIYLDIAKMLTSKTQQETEATTADAEKTLFFNRLFGTQNKAEE